VVGQKQALARTFGLSDEDVVVHSRFIGGGFGGKLFLWPHSVAAALAARVVERPVKLVLDRRSEFTTAGHRPVTRQRIRLGATKDGRLTSLRHDSLSHTSLVHEYTESCTDISRSLYACAHVATSQYIVPVHVGTPTPMRGPGETPGLWALESALDELACELQIDPLTLRLRNLPERDEGKQLPWSVHTHGECLELAARRFGWERRDPRVGSMRAGREIIGWGLASATWPGHRDVAQVQVELTVDGRARISCATQDIGTGTYTVLAQVLSELTGLPFARIDVAIGDSRLPEGPISGGSMATASVVPAVAEATRRAVQKLMELAVAPGGPFAGANPASLSFTAEGVQPATGGRFVSSEEILKAAGVSGVRGEARTESGEDNDRYSIRSFGAHCVEVRWDPGLARLRVSRVVSVIDTGRIINRHTAANQVYGSIMMGIGMTLLEQAIYDERSGRVVTDNLADYLVPVHADTPDMDLTLLDRPDPRIGEFGARGIGEIGLTGIAPAIAAAVHHATGKRLRDLPITVERLLG
jgi:xanthine dehydrogenase YagR molybdenum-binding subunit